MEQLAGCLAKQTKVSSRGQSTTAMQIPIEFACSTRRQLSWKIQEGPKGILIQLVWKPNAVYFKIGDDHIVQEVGHIAR